MKRNIFVQAATGAILLMVLYWISNFLLGVPNVYENFGWGFLSSYLVVLVLTYVNAHAHGGKLARMIVIFFILFLIGHFNILVEALIFDVTNRAETIRELVRGLLVSMAFSPLYVLLTGEPKPVASTEFVGRSFTGWAWRILAGDVIYLIFYLAAGMILTTVYPAIMQFYEGKIPPIPVILETQLFLRAFVFIGVALLVLRTIDVSIWPRAICVGLIFAILGGLAPLLAPNALMPGYVRLGHAFEVTISNFLFGIVLSFLLRQKVKSNNGAIKASDATSEILSV